MAQVKVVRRWRDRPRTGPAPAMLSRANAAPPRIVAIAASTGGPAALQRVLAELSASFPAPVLIVQHIAQGFVGGLVAWLNTVCSLKVKLRSEEHTSELHSLMRSSYAVFRLKKKQHQSGPPPPTKEHKPAKPTRKMPS